MKRTNMLTNSQIVMRERLDSLYPQAQMHLFHGSGHATAVVRQNEYLATIDAFLQEQGDR